MQIIILMNSLSIISTSFVAHFYFLLFFFYGYNLEQT